MNGCVVLVTTLALDGATAIVVTVWFTVTLTALVTDAFPASRMTTWRLYPPAFVKVAALDFAALFPFGLKPTAAGGVPVVDQV